MTSKQPTEAHATQPRKMCKACFAVIHPQAEICPKCGVRQFNPINKAALLLLTFFLGGIGAHKFYLGKNGQGVLYLLFFWTGIPGLIAFIEFFIYAFTDVEKLQSRYTRGHGGVAVALALGLFGLIAIIGVLAAIAIPQFVTYRSRAACALVENEVQLAYAAVEEYFLETDSTRAPTKEELAATVNYAPNAKVDVEVTGSRRSYQIIATDLSGNCRQGRVYRMALPGDSGKGGWQ